MNNILAIPKIPWEKRIVRAEKNGLFKKADIVAAGNWSRCAYGQSVGFPNTAKVPEYGTTLKKLGMLFKESVERHEILTARNLLNIILCYKEDN